MSTYLSSKDLAKEVCFKPNFLQTRTRINYLVEHYLSLENLRYRLEDLPKQSKFTSYSRHSLTRFRAILRHRMAVLSWDSWTSIEKIELIYTL